MRILLADDNRLVRQGIAGILSGEDDLVVCGQAADATETLQKAAELRPDAVLLDVSMPGMNGLDAARILRERFPEIKILILSQHDPGQLLAHALEAGAQGCLDKSRIATDLLPAIRKMLVARPS